MMSKSLICLTILLTTTAVISAQGCSVCGEGQQVGDPYGVFTFPGQPGVICGFLETAGEDGLIPLDSCQFLPTIISAECSCRPVGPPTPTSPLSVPTPAPSRPYRCSICGESREIESPENLVDARLFTFQDGQSITCADLKVAGEEGIISRYECHSTLQLYAASACGCKLIDGAEPPDSCSVCGENYMVGNPDAIFLFPGRGEVPCGILEEAGRFGLIPLEQCPFLAPLVTTRCECIPEGPTAPPTPAAPSPPPDFSCSVCGNDSIVGDSDAIFAFPGQPDITCGSLEEAGQFGLIPLDQCPFLAPLITDTCECIPDGPTAPPTPAAPSSPPTFSSCSICGEGFEVGKPNNIVTDIFSPFQINLPMSCGDLEVAGKDRLLGVCSAIRPLEIAQTCDCRPIDANQEVSPCVLCGEGEIPRDPTGIIVLPNFDEFSDAATTCDMFSDAAARGVLSGTECRLADFHFYRRCGGCRPDGPTATPTSAPSTSPPGCSVCGNGKEVGNPDTIIDSTVFMYGISPSTSCAELEDAGNNGLLSAEHCLFLPFLIHRECGCRRIAEEATALSTCPVCGYGRVVGAPDNVYQLAGQPPISCSTLEAGEAEGLTDECFIMPLLVGRQCECRAVDAEVAACSICGPGLEVGAPDNVGVVTSAIETAIEQRITCKDYEYAGETGLLGECQGLTSIFFDACACRAINVDQAATPTPNPPPPAEEDIANNSSLTPAPAPILPSVPASESLSSSSSSSDDTKSMKGMTGKGMKMKSKNTRVLREGRGGLY